ncbi:MAG: hypothetical protein PHY54_10660 [Methylococcales bacterium]|nr:hypothetical protein [Methylococcales bacterium]
MNKFAFLGLLAITLHFPAISYAEESMDDLVRRMEMQNREFQQRIEKSRLEWQQLEIDRLRSQAEFQIGNAELERLRMLNEADEATEELTERAEQAAQEQEESAQKAEEAAEEMRTLILQAEIKHKNQIFLSIVFLMVMGILWIVVKKYRKEGFMKDFEKFGVITILASGLLILLVLMISEPWVVRFDFIQNLMTALRIRLFDDCEGCNEFLIDIPTKYAVLVLLGLASYGFTTYLGITPPLKIKDNDGAEKTQSSAPLE